MRVPQACGEAGATRGPGIAIAVPSALPKSNHKTLAHAIFRNPYPAEFCGYPTVPILYVMCREPTFE
jgi:hypothetical protein